MDTNSDNASALADLAEAIGLSLPDDVIEASVAGDDLTITVQRPSIVKVLKFLRDDSNCQFTQLVDICGVDFPEREERFEVVYHLLSMNHNLRLRLKVSASEETPVPSVAEAFSCADWFEREIWDMYGVFFSDHPDLRRILTDYGFDGHPQRKDFPLTGYVEVRYDESQKRVIYEPVKLTQDFRTFDFMSPWEGAEHAHQQMLPGDEKATQDG
ncbi:MAG: NADH-quinone oxidoreductase subunit C [Alphaproteobacteria bacterium]|nr:NADH-quinone oxidoreductase subunit C [Alphaproteobacteria bacterium]